MIIRIRNFGQKATDDDNVKRDQHGHRHAWGIYSTNGLFEGRDDITTLNLVPQLEGEPEQFVLGRASGSLERTSMVAGCGSAPKILATFDTMGMPVRSATIASTNNSLLVTCLSDHTVAIYPTSKTGDNVQSLARTSVRNPANSHRTWTSKYLSQTRLAIGLGPSSKPIHIYDLASGTLDPTHSRALSFQAGATDHRVDVVATEPQATSVYAIAPLPSSSLSSDSDGEVFLSGAYDAKVRYGSPAHHDSPSFFLSAIPFEKAKLCISSVLDFMICVWQIQSSLVSLIPWMRLLQYIRYSPLVVSAS